jgi:hypothetical protein
VYPVVSTRIDRGRLRGAGPWSSIADSNVIPLQ